MTAVHLPDQVFDLAALAIEEGRVVEPAQVAEDAGLRYVNDAEPGITRVRAGRGFSYLDPRGRPLTDARAIERVKRLVIPPAWTRVWISPTANGHIQATGRDARGRKQYVYHPEWRRIRDETKFQGLVAFGALLPSLRAKVDHDLARPGASRERVLATIVNLLDRTAIRVGNEEYARENRSFGLTTLRSDHVDVAGATLRLHFRGKGGKELRVTLKSRRVAAMVKRLQELPGQELFQYRDVNGELRRIDSGHVNQYLREITGQDITAKEFRTWTASVTAAEALVAIGEFGSATALKRNINLAIDEAANRLGNTRSVARTSYVHPVIITAYTEGWLAEVWKAGYLAERPDGLRPEEQALLAVLVSAESRFGSHVAAS